MLLAMGSLLLIGLILVDSFETMVMPRRVTRKYRFTRLYYRVTWLPFRAMALSLPWPKRRASMLSLFGPASILGLMLAWVIGLILAFAILHWSLSTPLNGATPDFFTCFYLSGVTFFTLGYGDITATEPLGRFFSIAEAGVGFGFLAMVISYLPLLSQAFSAREVPIGLLDARAGSPPSAGELMLRSSQHRETSDIPEFLREWEVWSAQVLESHLSFPVLSFYRSQHDNQSWLAALTAILDTCTILIAALDIADTYRAQLTFAMSRHALVDLALALRTPPQVPNADRFTKSALERLRAELSKNGVALREGPKIDAKIDELRAMYEPFAAGLSQFLAFDLPPLLPARPLVDNWQTSAWMRRAPQFLSLAQLDARDDHFE